MRVRKYCGMFGDRGQAFPIYLTVIGALLFLAFAYFAVGQAAATKNGAQTAADASALAAAQDSRDQLRNALLNLLGPGGPGSIGDVLNGNFPGLQNSCDKAGEFAQDNNAQVTSCDPVYPSTRYTVSVRTSYTVGTSVIPGTENKHADAKATAVVEPLCQWQALQPSAPPSAVPSPTPSPSNSASPKPSPGTLVCGVQRWVVDPGKPSLPPAADLFSVHLTS